MPAQHDVHVPRSGPEEPALQVQAVAMRLPTGELEFDWQALHVAAPRLGLKVPAPHDVHVPPSGPEEPALQVQAVWMELPKSEFEYAGHAKHVETWLAPTDAEYVPTSQSTHAVDPASALYLPATHSEHGPPCGPVYPALHEHFTPGSCMV